MQNKLHKSIYKEFVYCDPNDHLMKTDNKLTRPKYNCRHCRSNNNCEELKKIITIQSDISGQNINTSPTLTPEFENKTELKKTKSKPEKQLIYDEETFNQIELRGFITKDLLKQLLERESNLFHISEDIFDNLCDKYHQFKEFLHTLTTEFDNTVECIIDTGKELTKKISHVIYELYLAVMHKQL